MVEPTVWEGVQSLLDDYVQVRPTDCTVLLYTSDSQDAVAWVSAALELRRIPTTRVWMAPLRDEGFAQRLADALPSRAALGTARLVVLSFERDTFSHTTTLTNALAAFPPAQRAVFRAISAGAGFFASAMRRTPTELSDRNASLLARLMGARRLRVTTRGGTDLRITLDAKYRWISNRGIARTGGVVVLPAGEIATYPASVSGLLVADFAFNVNAIVERDARLHHAPVRVTIQDSRVQAYACNDVELKRFLDECFHTDLAFNVGELGFGTNTGVVESLPLNSHVNERRPGIHIGFGQHNQDPGVVPYQCPIHIDLIAQGGQVFVDDDPTPIDLESFVPARAAHPDAPRDEDVFSPEAAECDIDDCCGIFTEDGLRLFRGPQVPT